jgi:hypothetical protein
MMMAMTSAAMAIVRVFMGISEPVVINWRPYSVSPIPPMAPLLPGCALPALPRGMLSNADDIAFSPSSSASAPVRLPTSRAAGPTSTLCGLSIRSQGCFLSERAARQPLPGQRIATREGSVSESVLCSLAGSPLYTANLETGVAAVWRRSATSCDRCGS